MLNIVCQRFLSFVLLFCFSVGNNLAIAAPALDDNCVLEDCEFEQSHSNPVRELLLNKFSNKTSKKVVVYGALIGVFLGSVLIGGLLPGTIVRVIGGELSKKGIFTILKEVGSTEGTRVFFSSLIGQLTTLGIIFGLSPMWEPLQAAVKKRTFQLIQDKDEVTLEKKVSPMGDTFDSQWKEMQGYFSMNAQWNRNVYTLMLISFENNLLKTQSYLDQGNIEMATKTLSLALIKHRQIFPEIGPESPMIRLTIDTTLTAKPFLDDQFLKRVLQTALKYTEGENLEGAELAYGRILSVWFEREILF